MTREEQKEEEFFFVEKLLRQLGLTPVIEPEEGTPAPDFEVDLGHMTVGIEVTKLFRAKEDERAPIQAFESAEDRLFALAMEQWSERDGPNVHVSVHLDSVRAVEPKRVAHLAERLVELVAANLPTENSVERIERSWGKPPALPEEFVSISIVRRDSLTRSFWNGGAGAIVPKLTVEDLKAIESRKRLADYSLNEGQSWLLIVMDSFRHSGMFDIDGALEDLDCIDLEFDRIWLMDALTDAVWELPPCGRDTSVG